MPKYDLNLQPKRGTGGRTKRVTVEGFDRSDARSTAEGIYSNYKIDGIYPSSEDVRSARQDRSNYGPTGASSQNMGRVIPINDPSKGTTDLSFVPILLCFMLVALVIETVVKGVDFVLCQELCRAVRVSKMILDKQAKAKAEAEAEQKQKDLQIEREREIEVSKQKDAAKKAEWDEQMRIKNEKSDAEMKARYQKFVDKQNEIIARNEQIRREKEAAKPTGAYVEHSSFIRKQNASVNVENPVPVK